MPRYHPKLGLPAGLTLPRRLTLRHSAHALEMASRRGLKLPRHLFLNTVEVFEVVTDDDGRLHKLGLRYRHDERCDCCLVVANHGQLWNVVTCYGNDRGDDHRSLDHRQYDNPREAQCSA